MRRLNRDIGVRVTEEQREFLEKYAAETDTGICAAVRFCINKVMKSEA